MSQEYENRRSGLIESAMGRAAHSASVSPESVSSLESRLASRREQDREMHKRLKRLQKALEEQAPRAPVTETFKAAPPPAAWSAATSAQLLRPEPGFTTSTLAITALLSVLIGAVGMRLAMTPVEAPLAKPLHQAKVAPRIAPLASAALTAPAPATTSTAAAAAVLDDESQAHAFIERWRQAWEARDVEAYLGSYSPSFAPANGQSVADWREARRKNLTARPDIRVTMQALQLEAQAGGHIKASFLQDYASGTYRESARPKTLLLTRTGNGLQIAGEWQGDHKP